MSENIPHDSAVGHVSGSSVYADDRPMAKKELIVGYVTAKVSAGHLQGLDVTEALALPGVVAVYQASDLAKNLWGTVVQDQPLLVSDKIQYFDEPVAIIAAENEVALREAKRRVRLKIEPQPAVLRLDEAIQQKNFLYVPAPFVRGDAIKAMRAAPHKLKGEIKMGGQEHFYMENQAAVAYPLENGQIEVHSSTQHPTETQHVVAKALGIEYHKVTCITKRLGGGFGGKESQAAPIAAMAALVAQKTQRPARMVLSKDDDMKITGKRHPFLNRYEVGFDDDGNILAARFELYADGGAYTDLSPSILERAMFHVENCYYIPDIEIQAACCKTNMHSNTAFRGFGGPQGAFVIESVIEDIAKYLGKDAYDLRQKNSYQGDRNITPYGQKLIHNPLPQIFAKLRETSKYDQRLAEIKNFNSSQKTKLRGISMTGTKFGIAFTARFLNQGNALVILHADGTAQVSTGAVEMGQGVNTKIQQIVAAVFAITPNRVTLMATATDKNANTSPTAASSGTDINGSAAEKAALRIRARLSQVAEKYFAGEIFDNLAEFEVSEGQESKVIEFRDGQVWQIKLKKSAKLADIIRVAHLNRISLSEYAHFKTEGIGFDKQKLIGKPFKYFTCGAAVSEVEVDRYTGEVKVLQTDILLDLGRPINPGIDRGQTTGAFVQGMGWVLTEKLYHNSSGELISHSPTTYKIPNVQDTPRIFKVDFVDPKLSGNLANEASVRGSKAVGEPPFLLGISCWTAVKNAVSFLKNNPREPVRLESPATGEVTLLEMER
jgi:xanthine dehydrogenase large subunit